MTVTDELLEISSEKATEYWLWVSKEEYTSLQRQIFKKCIKELIKTTLADTDSVTFSVSQNQLNVFLMAPFSASGIKVDNLPDNYGMEISVTSRSITEPLIFVGPLKENGDVDFSGDFRPIFMPKK